MKETNRRKEKEEREGGGGHKERGGDMTCSTVRKKSVNTGVTHEMEHAGPKTHANRHTHS